MFPIKAKLYAILAGIGGILLGIIKFLSFRNKQLKDQRDQYKADIDFREDVDDLDEEISQKFSHRAEEAREALKNDEIPEHLRNPRD